MVPWGYLLILLLTAYCAGIGLFGADWLSVGALDAGATREWWRALTALTLHLDQEPSAWAICCSEYLQGLPRAGCWAGRGVGDHIGRGRTRRTRWKYSSRPPIIGRWERPRPCSQPWG